MTEKEVRLLTNLMFQRASQARLLTHDPGMDMARVP